MSHGVRVNLQKGNTMQLQSYATKIILALEYSQVNPDDVSKINLDEFELSSIAIKLDLMYQILQNNPELDDTHPSIAGEIKQIKTDFSSLKSSSQETIEDQIVDTWDTVIEKLPQELIENILGNNIASTDATMKNAIAEQYTNFNQDIQKHFSFMLHNIYEDPFAPLLGMINPEVDTKERFLEQNNSFEWLTDRLKKHFRLNINPLRKVKSFIQFLNEHDEPSYSRIKQILYPNVSTTENDVFLIFYKHLPQKYKIELLAFLTQLGNSYGPLATILLLSDQDLLLELKDKALAHITGDQSIINQQAQKILAGTFCEEMSALLEAISNQAFDEEALKDLQSKDILGSENAFRTIYQIKTTSNKLNILNGLKEHFQVNTNLISLNSFTLNQLTKLDKSTSGLLTHREQFYNLTDAQRELITDCFEYLSLKFWQAPTQSISQKKPTCNNSRSLLLSAWQARIGIVSDDDPNQYLGLRRISNARPSVQSNDSSINLIPKLNQTLATKLNKMFVALHNVTLDFDTLISTADGSLEEFHYNITLHNISENFSADVPFRCHITKLPIADETPLEADETHLEDEATRRLGYSVTRTLIRENDQLIQSEEEEILKTTKIIEQAIEELFNTIVTLNYEHFKEDSGVADRFKDFVGQSNTSRMAELFTLIDDIKLLNNTLLNLHLSCLVGINDKTLDNIRLCRSKELLDVQQVSSSWRTPQRGKNEPSNQNKHILAQLFYVDDDKLHHATVAMRLSSLLVDNITLRAKHFSAFHMLQTWTGNPCPLPLNFFQNGEQTNTTQNLLANPEPESKSFSH